MVYDILIQPQSEGTYRATVIGWPDLTVVGNSEQSVIERIQQAIRERLTHDKIVRITVDEDTLETDVPNLSLDKHPWKPFLGMWKDDPGFDDFVARMEAYRQEVDEAIE